MSLFIDVVKRARWGVLAAADDMLSPVGVWDSWQAATTEMLHKAPVFDISNVADYFYLGTDQEMWDLFTDFPRPIPPFSRTWFEWRLPKQTFTEGETRDLFVATVYDRLGCLFVCDQITDAETRLRLPPGCAYRVNMMPFGRAIAGGGAVAMPVVIFGLDQQFQPLAVSPPQHGTARLNYYYPGIDPDKLYQRREEMVQLGMSTCSLNYVPLLAASMLNCKNVVTRTVSASAALVKKHAKRGHAVTAEHFIIEIKPITEALTHATAKPGYSREAAPIMRGHFKDYTQGKGLFGKYKGQFWWSQRLTGDVLPHYELAAAVGPLDARWPAQVEKRKK